MDIQLLKHLGNIDQIAGIRESVLTGGRGGGLRLAEFYNASGLRFTVLPDRSMDLYELSYRGVNLSFQTKNGPVSPNGFSAQSGEFSANWSGGALVTCGLDNVGGHIEDGENFPTHGRIGYTPAKRFGTRCAWDGDDYRLFAEGEVHQTRLYGRHLILNRTVETGLYSRSLKIRDTVTNCEAEREPLMLLYHCNFGYPLLQADSRFASTEAEISPLTDISHEPNTMTDPVDGQEEELYLYRTKGSRAIGVIYNRRIGLGAYVSFDTLNLPNFLQWKLMRSHDYVLAIEPCNTLGISRSEAMEKGEIAYIEPYSSIDTELEIGVLDGEREINAFLKNNDIKEKI